MLLGHSFPFMPVQSYFKIGWTCMVLKNVATSPSSPLPSCLLSIYGVTMD